MCRDAGPVTWHTAFNSPLCYLIKKKSIAAFSCAYSTPHCVPVESNILQIDNIKSRKFEGNLMMNPRTETEGKCTRQPEDCDMNREKGWGKRHI